MIGNLASFRQSPAEFLMTFDRAAIIFQGYRVDRPRHKYLFWPAALRRSLEYTLLLKFNQWKINVAWKLSIPGLRRQIILYPDHEEYIDRSMVKYVDINYVINETIESLNRIANKRVSLQRKLNNSPILFHLVLRKIGPNCASEYTYICIILLPHTFI